jgi:uncharacterized membrane protein YbhN (UPF0104 family)
LYSHAIAIGSLALATVLLFLLLKLTRVDLGSTIHLLAAVRPLWFGAVVALTAVISWLAAEKWRIANRAAGGPAPSMWSSFALTAVGGGLGHVLPAQMATAFARATGARVLGAGTMLRAGATTIFEQIFDFLVFLCFALVSALTLALHGGVQAWLEIAVPVIVPCWLAAGHATRLMAAGVAWLLRRLPRRLSGQRFAAGFLAVGEADPRLARRLFLISVLRFAVLVGVCASMTAAVGLRVTVWQVAAAIPFAVIAMGLAVTPAGLGVTEWAMAGALLAFGVEMRTAVQWVVLSRILSTLASLLVGALGVLMAAGLWHSRDQAPIAVATEARDGLGG